MTHEHSKDPDSTPNNGELGDAYEAAWAEWEASRDAELWDSVVGD